MPEADILLIIGNSTAGIPGSREDSAACTSYSLVSAADEILAREWFERGITLEQIEWVILIGCIRKYVSCRNNQTRAMIGSLKYFAPVLEEVLNMKADPEYWAYLRYRLTRMENEWKHNRNESASHNAEDAIAPGMGLS